MTARRTLLAVLGTSAWLVWASGAPAATPPAFADFPAEWTPSPPFLAEPVHLSWTPAQFNQDSIQRGYRLELTAQLPSTPTPAAREYPETAAAGRLPAGLVEGALFTAHLTALEKDCDDIPAGVCVGWSSAVTQTPATGTVAFRADRTAPVVTAFALDGGAAYTATRTVRAGLTATDAISGVAGLQLADSATFTCDDEASCPRDFAGVVDWTLAEGPDGPRTVHARVFDRARPTDPAPVYQDPGNPSAAVADGIFLDRVDPTAAPSARIATVAPGEQVAFSSAGSRDDTDGPDDSGLDPAGFTWDFGDGTAGSGPSPTHAYAAAGRYVALLTVRDRAGNPDTGPVTVTVTAPSADSVPPPGSGAGGAPPATPTAGPGIRSVRAAAVWRTGTLIGVRVTLAARRTVRMRVLRLDDRGRARGLVVGRRLTTGPGTALFRFRAPRAGRYRLVVDTPGATVTRTVRVRAR